MNAPEWATNICNSFPKTVGGKPRYRVIWAPDRLETMRWQDPTGGIVVKQMCAYPAIGNKWIIETLVPWEKFGAWDFDHFGPKPQAEGEWCHSFTIMKLPSGEFSFFDHTKNEVGAFLSLDDFGAELLRLTLICIEKGRAISAWQMKNHREEMLKREDDEQHARFEDVYNDAAGIGLVGGPLGENAISGIPGKRTSADIILTDIDSLSPELRKKYRCPPGGIKQV